MTKRNSVDASANPEKSALVQEMLAATPDERLFMVKECWSAFDRWDKLELIEQKIIPFLEDQARRGLCSPDRVEQNRRAAASERCVLETGLADVVPAPWRG
jgi:hypothetical protein